ncbi:Predicted amidohydrolase [Propionibacterium cyclohexanicum]|uniref:Predicted amidohydrolase n=1 Tax=Propionibacterium cyclohexanicum TaxID=64702 RepID=A0A1H9PRY4_9ACTN|nr:nitrilase-related carbon-nitrogen hydrolase [Propionibacterium cyclohexanicum]SER50952.1 Predicted amidohydrolase [Propionibacterium cyclohexanicum]
MDIALGQLKLAADAETNLAQITASAEQAAASGARMLVVPEGLTARDSADPYAGANHPQSLDGPLVSGIRAVSARLGLAIAGSLHTPVPGARVANTGFIVDGGELVACYRKIHLYDAFSARESRHVQPGVDEPPVVEIDGLPIGLMICYDLRFPETARSLAVRGAQLIVMPAAWAAGPLKEMHWQVLAMARAVENTVYLAACSEVSSVNIGRSLLVDPLGVVVAAAGTGPELLIGHVDPGALARARTVLPVLANREYRDPQLRSAGGHRGPA